LITCCCCRQCTHVYVRVPVNVTARESCQLSRECCRRCRARAHACTNEGNALVICEALALAALLAGPSLLSEVEYLSAFGNHVLSIIVVLFFVISLRTEYPCRRWRHGDASSATGSGAIAHRCLQRRRRRCASERGSRWQHDALKRACARLSEKVTAPISALATLVPTRNRSMRHCAVCSSAR